MAQPCIIRANPVAAANNKMRFIKVLSVETIDCSIDIRYLFKDALSA
jgi:hypothetical protein